MFCVLFAGAALSSLDAIASATMQLNQLNPMVFDSGSSGTCGPAYKDLLCALLFPLCPTTQRSSRACASRCVDVLNQCGVNVTHQFLYDCSAMVQTGSDSVGTCPANGIYIIYFVYMLWYGTIEYAYMYIYSADGCACQSVVCAVVWWSDCDCDWLQSGQRL